MKKIIFTMCLILASILPVQAASDLADSQVYVHTPGNLVEGRAGQFESNPNGAGSYRGMNYWYVKFTRPVGDFDQLAQESAAYQVAGYDFSGQLGFHITTLAKIADARRWAKPASLSLREESLKYLNLKESGVDDSGLSILAQIPSLEVLILGKKITDSGLRHLSSLSDLVELGLSGAAITDAGLKYLGSLKKLTTLDLRNTTVGEKGLLALGQLPLRHLRLGPKVGDNLVMRLKPASSVQFLDLSQTQATDKGMPSLSQIAGLQTLFLSRSITDRGVETLSRSPRLMRLDLTGARITNASAKRIAQITTLEELALSQTAIDDASLAMLAALPKLRFLEISDTRITLAGLKNLSGASSLEVLSFSSKQPVKLGDLKPLGALPKLQTIIINGSPLGPEGMDYIRKEAPKSAHDWRWNGWVQLAWAGEAAAILSDQTELAQLPKSKRFITAASLSGLERIHTVESELDHVISAPSDPGKENQHTEANFLGEITVGVQGKKK